MEDIRVPPPFSNGTYEYYFDEYYGFNKDGYDDEPFAVYDPD